MRFTTLGRRWPVGSFPLAALVLITLGAGAPQHGPATDTVADPIEMARRALRAGEPEKAAGLLKALDVSTMNSETARRFRLYARDAAVRTGDRAWLEKVNDTPDRTAFADGYTILTAWSFLKAADFPTTRFYLGLIKNFKELNEREKRRVLAIRARLEQLDGTPVTERAQVDQLMAYVGRWASPTCMACHANEKQPGETASLDVNNWWGAQRYVALMKTMGDAPAVRDQARARLQTHPDDEAAKLRLAFALRAMGDEAGAIQGLREISWAEFPDREKVAPKDIIIFP